MNCPSCGSETFASQQFCRSCGAELTEDAPHSFNPRAWGLFVLMLVFGGLLAAMAGKLFELKWLIFAGLFIMIGGIFLVAAYGLLRETRPRKRKAKPSPQIEPELSPADTTNKLLPIGENDFVPSVVERTTDLLKNPASGQSTSNDS